MRSFTLVVWVVLASVVLALPVADAPARGRTPGLASTAPTQPPPGDGSSGPARGGQAGPVVGGLSASSVGVLVVDGGRHQCSAAVVASRSQRVLATAAHCVWLDDAWQLSGAFFVPGYAGGEEPFGRWAVETAWVPAAWQRARSPITDVAASVDYAFVTLSARDGQLPESVLGAQGIRFDTADRFQVAALGYPSLAPYDGQSLRACVGGAQADQLAAGPRHPAGQVLVLECDMTEGASGGPWLTGPDPASGRGQVIGVVSGGDDTTLISPRFGADAERLYRTADDAALTGQPDRSR